MTAEEYIKSIWGAKELDPESLYWKDPIIHYWREIFDFMEGYCKQKLADQIQSNEISVRDLTNNVKGIQQKHDLNMQAIELAQEMFPPKPDVYP